MLRSNETLMENKKTTELIDQLQKLDEDKGDWSTGGKYEQIMGELVTRYPFYDILNEDHDESLPAVWRAIEELREEVKKLKRHKHDPNSGDVMVRV